MKPSTRRMLEADKSAHQATAELERGQAERLEAEAASLRESAKRHMDYVADLNAMLTTT